jgi:hypothetical protein
MKHGMWKAGLIVAVVIAIMSSAALAEGTAAAPAKEEPKAPAPAAAPAPAQHQELFWPELWETLHDPAPWLSMGLDFRFRVVGGENWQTLNDDLRNAQGKYLDTYLFQRYRTRWWTKWILDEDVTFNTRLVWEFRTWEQPDGKGQIANPVFPGAPGEPLTHFNGDEALFDWFNINVRNIGDLPLSATIGRQDMVFGVGWLVLDASPLDGSRTIGLFDAARFTYDWAEANTKIDAVYVNVEAHSQGLFDPINDQDRGVTEQDENGVILYLTNTAWKPVQLEGYFIFRDDNPINEQLSNFPYGWSRKADIYTVGAAVSGTQGDHWKYRAEAALQRGDRTATVPPAEFFTLGALGPDRDIEAYGTLSTVEYLFKDAHNNATHLSYEYDSGDDPATDEDEQFDLLWGEWPRWSELMIYTWANETQVAATTNLHRINVGHRVDLSKKWTLTADYHALWADQNPRPTKSGPTGINTSTTDRFRGHLFTSWLRYKFSSQLYGHFLAEYFINGQSYYVAPSDDNAYFLRFNLEYIF